MITKNSSATIVSGSQKSRAWSELPQVGARDHPRRARLAGAVAAHEVLLPADREVELFEARALGLDARRGARRRRRARRRGRARRSRASSSTVATPLRSYARTNGKLLRGVEHVGSSASSTTRAAGQYGGVSSAGEPDDHRLTVVHHDHLVGEPFGFEQEVRAHQDGLAALGHLVDEAEHRAGRLGVEPRGRLVEQQEVGLVQHRTGRARAGRACRWSTRRPCWSSASAMPKRSAASAMRSSIRRRLDFGRARPRTEVVRAGQSRS